MKYILNIWLARVSLAASILLIVIFLLKKAHMQPASSYILFCRKANHILRELHKPLGILLVITGIVHGLLSSESVFTFNLGTFCWILSVLLGINWIIRSRLKKKGWMYYHHILTLLFCITLLYHIIDVGGFVPLLPANVSATTNTTGKIQVASQYKDGEYTGTATGFRPGLKVKVTVKDGKIAAIEILEHNEKGQRYYGPPMEIIPQEIIENQSTDVDVVSGATKTSIGIMKAVENALNGVSTDDESILSEDNGEHWDFPEGSTERGSGRKGEFY